MYLLVQRSVTINESNIESEKKDEEKKVKEDEGQDEIEAEVVPLTTGIPSAIAPFDEMTKEEYLASIKLERSEKDFEDIIIDGDGISVCRMPV